MWERIFFPWPVRRPKEIIKREKRHARRWPVFLLAFFLAGFTLFIYTDYKLRPTLDIIAKNQAVKVATLSINQAVKEKVALNIHYEDLISVKTDNRGKIVLMQPNTGEINRLASEATLEVQRILSKETVEKIYVPLGQVTGNKMLANMGPRIPIYFQPIGVVDTRVMDRFEQAGINQTRHQIYLEVSSKVRIMVPLYGSEVVVKTEVPISEAIIMGEVPQVYISGSPRIDKYLP